MKPLLLSLVLAGIAGLVGAAPAVAECMGYGHAQQTAETPPPPPPPAPAT